MFVEERKNEIYKLLTKQGKVRVNNLSKLFNVSEATIRRDLQEMEESGVVKRAYGGAILSEHTKFEPSFLEKKDKYYEEKQKIGKLAHSLINNGDTIILDSGTTTLEIAKNIKVKNITVVTNSLDIAYELVNKDGIEVFVIGGTLRLETHAMVGPLAEAVLDQIRVDKAFMGANGVCVENGITTPNIIEAKTKKKMMDISNEIILLCDHSKFNQICFSKICNVDEVDMIITDNKVNKEILQNFSDIDVELVLTK